MGLLDFFLFIEQNNSQVEETKQIDTNDKLDSDEEDGMFSPFMTSATWKISWN